MLIHADGNKLKVGDQVIVLRGANIVNYTWKYPHNRSASQYEFDLNALDALLSDWNGVAGTIWVCAGPINRDEPEFMDFVDRAVNVAVERKGYVIMSYASDEPDRDTHPFLISNAGIQMHKRLAARYRNIPNVLHATQAEPGRWTSSRNVWLELRDVQERTIDAIREERPDACIGVSGTNWSQSVGWFLNDPVRRDNIWVKPHIYARQNNFNYGQALDVAQVYPVVIGEFGTGGRMDNSDSRALIRLCEDREMGWQGWNLNNEGPPVMLNSKNPNNRTSYGNIVYNELRSTTRPEPGPVDPPQPVTIPFKLNTGGSRIGDWHADQPWTPRAQWGFLPTSARRAEHDVQVDGGTSGVHNTERWGIDEYRIRVPNGKYDVHLHFAETWDGINGANQRVYDVYVQGKKELSSLDVYSDSGFAVAQVEVVSGVEVDDELLAITFDPDVEEPMIKGIEVVKHEPDDEDNGNGEEPPDEEDDEELEELKRLVAELKSDLNIATDEIARLKGVIHRAGEVLDEV